MNAKLKEFIGRNEEALNTYYEFIAFANSISDDDPYSIDEYSLEIYPVEYQEFIKKFENKAKEIDKIEDENKKGTILLKSLIEELKEKANLYNYLNEIYKELKQFKQSHKNHSLSDDWDYFIGDTIETLEENRTPLQRYYELQNIKLPLKELEKLLNPISIEKELDRETIREIRQEFRNKRIKELAELKKREIEDKEKIISKHNELVKEEDEFIESLTGERIYLFYFNHNLEAFGEKDLWLVDSLIDSYIQQKINVNIDDIYPVFNKAIVKKGIVENLTSKSFLILKKLNSEIEIIKSNKTDKSSIPTTGYSLSLRNTQTTKISFNRIEVFERILNKFRYEAEEKRKAIEEKNKTSEDFYKGYNGNKTQIAIPYVITRNNPCYLTPEKLENGKEIKINSYWSSFIIQATKDTEMFDVVDIKNLLTIFGIKSSYVEFLRKNKVESKEILNKLVLDGVYIPLPLVADLREISKRKENYLKIIESIDKAQKLQIKGKIATDIRGEPLEVNKYFSLISEYEEITFKNKKALNIKLSPTVANILIEKKGKFYNRKLINKIPDSLLPLYFFIDNLRLNQSIKEKVISKKDLLINSRISYGKTAALRPDKADKYLKEKLNRLKQGILIEKGLKIKLLKDWEETEMYNGELGIKLFFN